MSSTMTKSSYVRKDSGTLMVIGASYLFAAATAFLEPEPWKLVLVGASVAMLPALGEWMLSKYPSTTVRLFGMSLPFIAVGTYKAGAGLLHPLYTPLLVLTSWTMCVGFMTLLDLAWRGVEACVSSICQGADRLATTATQETHRAVVASASMVQEYRKCTAAAVIAAGVAFPTIRALLVVGCFMWMVCLLVEAVVFLFQCVIAAVVAVKNATIRAVCGVAVAISSAIGAMLSAARSILAALFWFVVSLLLSTAILILKLAAFSLKTASILAFLENPSAETFAAALMIKVSIAFLKFAFEN